MNRRRKITLALAVLMAALFLLSGCGGSKPLTKFTPQEGVEPVVLTGAITAKVENGKITAYLTSNLEVGTVVRFTVDSYDGDELAEALYSISGENVKVEFDIEEDWSGKVYVSAVACPSVGSQPKAVTEVYGRYFQNIDGENVIWNSKENIFVVQSEKFSVN